MGQKLSTAQFINSTEDKKPYSHAQRYESVINEVQLHFASHLVKNEEVSQLLSLRKDAIL